MENEDDIEEKNHCVDVTPEAPTDPVLQEKGPYKGYEEVYIDYDDEEYGDKVRAALHKGQLVRTLY